MATITSPRPTSTTWASSPTPSSRTSIDTLRPSTSISSRTASPSRHPPPAQPPHHPRRNRAALRDYYGLKNTAPADASSGLHHQQQEDADVKESILDGEGFDAEAYVKELLERESLSGLLKVEGELMDEIKGLDGERKALVYDNYSKLIVATDTIRKMRTNMDPLTPTTNTLPPAIAHIAETAASLAASMQRQSNSETLGVPNIVKGDEEAEKRSQRATARWVLGTPKRLQECIKRGERDEAVKDWEEVKALLDKWEGTKGVDQVREECLKALSAE